MKTNIFLILLFYPLIISAKMLPDGWVLPFSDEFNLKWRNKNTHRYLKSVGDYDGNGIIDTAYYLESKTGNDISVYVLLMKRDSDVFINLITTEHDSSQKEKDKFYIKRYKTAFGIETIQPGKYKTACGKGYWECVGDEKPEITIKYHGISFFRSEACGTRYFYWDNELKNFRHFWING